MKRIPACLIAALTMFAPAIAGAGEVTFTPSPSGQIEFMMPSNNIACIYTPKGGTCDLHADRRWAGVVLHPRGTNLFGGDPGADRSG